VGLATIGEDRLVGLDATGRGTLLTRPFQLDGRRLLVNANVREGGSVRVGVIDRRGKMLKRFSIDRARPIEDDQPAAVANWKGNPKLSSLGGDVVQLRFEVERATIYSFGIAK
jgi:hypothetical protein